MNKLFKIDIYYLKTGTEYADLYAYTTDMKLSKEFRNTRNMDKFIYKRMEFTSPILNLFEQKHSDKKLIKFTELTKHTESGEFEFVYTNLEVLCISDTGDNYIYNLMWNYVSHNPLMFNDKYIKALRGIGYNLLWSLQSDQSFRDELFNVDYMGSLINMYGHTLKE